MISFTETEGVFGMFGVRQEIYEKIYHDDP
jgi:hypothetical protein